MIVKLPILVRAEKHDTSLVYCTEPRAKTDEQSRKMVPISRESQSGVSMVRSMVERIYRKGKF